MVLIKFIKTGEFYVGCSFLGHVSNQKSDSINLVCASVSILSQSLYSFIKSKSIVLKNEEIEDGYLSFVISAKEQFSDSLIQSSFELILHGLELIRKKYPKEIKIIGV